MNDQVTVGFVDLDAIPARSQRVRAITEMTPYRLSCLWTELVVSDIIIGTSAVGVDITSIGQHTNGESLLSFHRTEVGQQSPEVLH